MRIIIAFLVACFVAKPCLAWSEGGHHLIAVMAFDSLTDSQQQEIIEALRAHPRFAEDFKFPKKVGDEMHWLIGRAAYWPDITRKGPYHRPGWHWQLGATLVIGKPPNVPEKPGPCPEDATLETKELHIAQAIDLCRKIWRDKTQSASDRAIALCWLGHLVGDAHQPCHAGSIYSETLFPNGDRWANLIATKQGKNLHNLWDGLLGDKFDAGDVRRRQLEITADPELTKSADKLGDKLDPMDWLAESVKSARSNVYTSDILNTIKVADLQGFKMYQMDLSPEYLQRAGRVAQERAAVAARRLTAIWTEGLGE